MLYSQGPSAGRAPVTHSGNLPVGIPCVSLHRFPVSLPHSKSFLYPFPSRLLSLKVKSPFQDLLLGRHNPGPSVGLSAIPHSEINKALKPNSNDSLFKLIATRVFYIILEMNLHSLAIPDLSPRRLPGVPAVLPSLTGHVSKGELLSFFGPQVSNLEMGGDAGSTGLLVWEAKERLDGDGLYEL